MHDTPTLQDNKTCREDGCIWYVTTPGLSHPFLGMGPGLLELGKSVVFWIKLGKKCNFLHVCLTFLLLDFQKSSHEIILMNTHMFLYGDIQKIILHLSSNTLLVCSTQLHRTECNKEFHFWQVPCLRNMAKNNRRKSIWVWNTKNDWMINSYLQDS